MPEAGTQAALLRLLAWVSPAFPVGSFSYSHGLEQAVDAGAVSDRGGLRVWIEALLESGSGWNDAVLLAEAWRNTAAGVPLAGTAELAEALSGSAERHLESMSQGSAFLVAAQNWQGSRSVDLPKDCPYSVALGAVSAANGIPLEHALAACLQAFVSNQLQAAIRLSMIGQADAAALLADFETRIVKVAGRAARSTLDDLGSATIAAEIASMNHETQYSRLFRS